MEISDSDFENYGEVDCKARVKVLHIKTTGALPVYSLSIRKVGKDQYQAYAKFAQPMLMVHSENGQTDNINEVVLFEGQLHSVVAFTNKLTGMKDKAVKVKSDSPEEPKEDTEAPVNEEKEDKSED